MEKEEFEKHILVEQKKALETRIKELELKIKEHKEDHREQMGVCEKALEEIQELHKLNADLHSEITNLESENKRLIEESNENNLLESIAQESAKEELDTSRRMKKRIRKLQEKLEKQQALGNKYDHLNNEFIKYRKEVEYEKEELIMKFDNQFEEIVQTNKQRNNELLVLVSKIKTLYEEKEEENKKLKERLKNDTTVVSSKGEEAFELEVIKEKLEEKETVITKLSKSNELLKIKNEEDILKREAKETELKNTIDNNQKKFSSKIREKDMIIEEIKKKAEEEKNEIIDEVLRSNDLELKLKEMKKESIKKDKIIKERGNKLDALQEMIDEEMNNAVVDVFGDDKVTIRKKIIKKDLLIANQKQQIEVLNEKLEKTMSTIPLTLQKVNQLKKELSKFRQKREEELLAKSEKSPVKIIEAKREEIKEMMISKLKDIRRVKLHTSLMDLMKKRIKKSKRHIADMRVKHKKKEKEWGKKISQRDLELKKKSEEIRSLKIRIAHLPSTTGNKTDEESEEKKSLSECKEKKNVNVSNLIPRDSHRLNDSFSVLMEQMYKMTEELETHISNEKSGK